MINKIHPKVVALPATTARDLYGERTVATWKKPITKDGLAFYVTKKASSSDQVVIK